MGREKRGACAVNVNTTSLRPFAPPPFSLPRYFCSMSHLSPFIQANLVRESEKMVGDTATRLERAAGELEDLLVRAPHISLSVCTIPPIDVRDW